MGWFCCYCNHGMLSFNSPICHFCAVHRRCRKCHMTTDSIDEQRYRIPLRPAWEAEENYHFERYHVPKCDREKCDGKCGKQSKKKLKEEIKLRRDAIRERREAATASDSTMTDGKEEPKTPPPPIGGKMEEPGDGAFTMGGKGKGKAKVTEEGSALKSRKKVTFASFS